MPLSVGVEPSASGAGVEADSDTWSIESAGLSKSLSLRAGAGEGASDEGVAASLGSVMPAIAASFCLWTRSTMTLVFLAIVWRATLLTIDGMLYFDDLSKGQSVDTNGMQVVCEISMRRLKYYLFTRNDREALQTKSIGVDGRACSFNRWRLQVFG